MIDALASDVDEALKAEERRYISTDDVPTEEMTVQQLRALSEELWKAHAGLFRRGMDAARGLERRPS